MKQEAELNYENDKKTREDIEILNSADSAAFQAEKSLKDLEDKISEEQKNDIKESLDLLKEVIKNKNVEESKRLMEEVTNKFQKLSQENNIPIIEDAAQSFGAKYNDKYSGTFGTAGVFSFGLFKNISAFYGGAIVTNDKILYEKIKNDIKLFKNIGLKYFISKIFYSILLSTILNKYIFSIFTFWIFRFGLLHNINIINNKLKIDNI
jgi:hypothetical protein